MSCHHVGAAYRLVSAAYRLAGEALLCLDLPYRLVGAAFLFFNLPCCLVSAAFFLVSAAFFLVGAASLFLEHLTHFGGQRKQFSPEPEACPLPEQTDFQLQFGDGE